MRFEFAPTDGPEVAKAEALQAIAHDVNRIAEEITDDGIRADGGVSAEESERPAFIDPQTESVECFFCGQLIEDMSRVEGIDISEPDAYYPKMRPVCSQHDTGGDGA